MAYTPPPKPIISNVQRAIAPVADELAAAARAASEAAAVGERERAAREAALAAEAHRRSQQPKQRK
jgi:hypothetical protein